MPPTLPDRVRLGAFELDLRTGELREGDRSLILTEQPLRILRMLVERAGELVAREEIRKALWPNDTVVEFDHSINAAVNRLRQALGDSPEKPKYVETIPRRGYRLLVAVEAAKAADNQAAREQAPEQSPEGNQHPGLPSREDGNLIGKKVSHYRVLEVIGGGGMGLVYKAEDLKLGRRVALKFLPEELAWDPTALQRFDREAKTASSLNHPNICTIYEIEEHEEKPFIVMELLEGETLRDRLSTLPREQKKLAMDELLDIAIQICRGLEAAHAKGIIHRDVKPANIFLPSSGQAKILDFGLAKAVSTADGTDGLELKTAAGAVAAPQPARPAQPDATLTRLGTAIGTAGYMSPEQIRGEPLDGRTDIFSFGLVLYEMATGERAFVGDTEAILHDAIQHREPKPLRELTPELAPKLENLITKCLQKDPEGRYQSASALLADLSDETEPAPALISERARNYWNWLAGVTAVLVFAGLIVGGWWWRTINSKVTPSPEITTSSPEALYAFMQGRKATLKDHGIPYFKRALELDPGFALAHLSLGCQYVGANKNDEGVREVERAYELRGHTSRPEQLEIEGVYYRVVTGELDEAVIRLEELARLRPNYPYPHLHLAYIFNRLGQYDSGEREAKEMVRLGLPGGYSFWVRALFGLNRLNEAKELLKDAEAHGYSGVELHTRLYLIASFESDEATMAKQLSLAMADPYGNEWAVTQKGDTAIHQGRFQEAWQYYSAAPGFDPNSFDHLVFLSQVALETGDVRRAKEQAFRAMHSAAVESRKTTFAIILARLGDAPDAERILQQVNERHPLSTIVQKLDLPIIRAAIQLGKNNPFQAITALETASPYELGNPIGTEPLYAVYLRGLAYLKLGQGREAAIEFQKIVDHPGIVQDSILYPVSLVYLARAYAMMGHKEAARNSYEDFLALWKDADPDIPIYKQAKAEYAKLQ